MADVEVGPGNLAGKGLYAGRDFRAGETVAAYALRPITKAEYDALPAEERLFVHSFAARRYLYPSPVRFVNHSDDPSCVQDFDGARYVARRAVAAGEAVTIDEKTETAQELSTFLLAYESAQEHSSAELLAALIHAEAVLWQGVDVVRGRDAVVAALIEQQYASLQSIEWSIGTGRWEALCSADGRSRDHAVHLSMLVGVVRGNWQLVYLHAG